MRIGIVFIATGKYYEFSRVLVDSFELNFLRNHDKEYFIFTDNENPDLVGKNINYIKKNKEEWPHDSLQRYKHIYNNREMFGNIDFIFFTNANMKAVKEVSEEIIPSGDFKFSAVLHPGYYLDDINELPYERNPNSLAYIPFGQGDHYYQGCFYGGYRENFIEMCKVLSRDIDSDVSRGIIASVIDESYTNKYFLDKKIMAIPSEYSYPEQILSGETQHCKSYRDLAKKAPIIIQIDKRNFGGHDFLRK